jgi:hypothetical protein
VSDLVVRAAGIPPTEVGGLTPDGAPVEPSAPLQGPAASLQDVGLGAHARRIDEMVARAR